MINESAQQIRTTVAECMAKINFIRAEIRKQIEELPDNPDIQRINEKCFTLPSSKLLVSGWSPQTYDFKLQYKALADLIDKCQPENVMESLFAALKTNKLGSIRLHPTVLHHVRGIMYEHYERVFNMLIARGITPAAASGTAAYICDAICTGRYNEMFHPLNRNSREIFRELTGISLPNSEIRTHDLFIGQPFAVR